MKEDEGELRRMRRKRMRGRRKRMGTMRKRTGGTEDEGEEEGG